MRDHADALGLDHVHLEQPRASSDTLDDDAVGQLREALDNDALAVRRAPRNGVQDRDHRDRQLFDEIDHLVAVLAAEDPELVLEDDHVDIREGCSGCAPRSARALHELGDDLGCAWEGTGPVEHRTTVTRWPERPEPSGKAAVNVAIPHLVGG